MPSSIFSVISSRPKGCRCWINFENKPTATAPAQVVKVTQQLDPNLDWSTFELGAFNFGDFTVPVPAGRQNYSARVDARSSLGVYVDVSAELNRLTGVGTWTLATIDPATFDEPSGDVIEGFLPPDDSNGHGEGWVSYTIQPKSTDTTGSKTLITDKMAQVRFASWSPDGKRIAFHSNRGGGAPQVWTVNADGSDLQQLTRDPKRSLNYPVWSPDGMRIAFDSFRDGNFEIYVVNTDGAGLMRLTDDPNADINRYR